MTTMSVPSTLVKCLYLFFDLPHMSEVPGATQTELPLADRRALLQKVFVQVSSRLCRGIYSNNAFSHGSNSETVRYLVKSEPKHQSWILCSRARFSRLEILLSH